MKKLSITPNITTFTIFVILWTILLLMGTGSVHLFDWDEINFAESAREMLVTNNFFRVQIDYEAFWEKPPFFFWLQVISMKLFGITAFAARLPNVIFGVFTVITLFQMGRYLHNKRFGIIWAALYLGSLLPAVYFKSGIIDPVFNYFIFTSIYFIILTLNSTKNRTLYALIAGTLNGIAVLTKGPVGFLLLFLTFLVYIIFDRFRTLPKLREVLVFAGAILAVTFLWYGVELIRNGTWFFKHFIDYQVSLFSESVAGHGQPFYYHFLVVFFGCFPMSVLALPSFIKSGIAPIMDFRKWMLVLFWVVMILFSIVKTKIVHYSSMSYFPLSYLAALYIFKIDQSRFQVKKIIRRTIVIVGVIVGVIMTAIPFVGYFPEAFIPLVNDKFIQAALQSPSPWIGIEFIWGILLIVLVILFARRLKANNLLRPVILWTTGILAVLAFLMRTTVPKVEYYTQRPMISFLKDLQGKDVYVTTIGSKSYAPYFYFRQPQYPHDSYKNDKWLLTGDIDKPAYFIAKIQDKDELEKYEDIQWLEDKGGFAFYKRMP